MKSKRAESEKQVHSLGEALLVIYIVSHQLYISNLLHPLLAEIISHSGGHVCRCPAVILALSMR